MPPRAAPRRGGPQGDVQSPRGPRGRGASRGIGNIPVGLPSSAHVRTVGVKRPDYGTAGRPLAIYTNSFVATIPDTIIRHYDPFSSNLHPRINRLLVKALENVAPNIFSRKTVFDGKKNLFASYELPLGPTHSKSFNVTLTPPGGSSDRPPKVHTITVTKVNEINPEVLQSFVNGQYSQDEEVLTAITALNVVVRMDPSEKYPFNIRSFFPGKEVKEIGMGLVLWRGYFQSVRPGIGRMLVNVDISTGIMYKPGNLIGLCLDFFNKGGDPNLLSPAKGLPDRERLRLQRFLAGVKITTPHTAGTRGNTPRIIKKLSTAGANATTFQTRDGQRMTVADYFRREANRPLRHPDLLCVEVGSGALLPLEMCMVPPGQIAKKQLSPEQTKGMVEFSTMKPQARFQSIKNGLDTVLAYGQSEYVRTFGMSVETSSGFLPTTARVLPTPTLKYGQGSKQLTIQPRDGAWNMIDKKFYKAEGIRRWVVISYQDKRRFGEDAVREMVTGLIKACETVGMTVEEKDPIVKWENGHQNIANQLRAAGQAAVDKAKREGRQPGRPDLIVVVLPDGGNEIYTKVKHFGDITMGVATQCLKSNKCTRAKPQYWANVCLKINPKLGGINVIPDPSSSARVLTDPAFPTIVMGADVIHPAPGSRDRPSFTAVVGNVDSENAKYIATTHVQTSRQEMIDDLQAMCREILQKYMGYRTHVERKSGPTSPKRLIFYRDGVSEGQFQQVLDLELPLIKAACADLKITPKITLIIVGKRHHNRFKTQSDRDADRSGNCPAGTVVDRDIGHPTAFDFFLQSHGGLLGTSRPAHYTVLYDENNFNSDSMQALSFALCHVYARSTRSVSIPAPVYYADIVCARAKNHYDPLGDLNLSETATQTEGATDTLESFRTGFKPLHENMKKVMYFS